MLSLLNIQNLSIKIKYYSVSGLSFMLELSINFRENQI